MGKQHNAGHGYGWTGGIFAVVLLSLAVAPLAARAQTLRIVTYNLAADVNGTAPNSGFDTVLEAIGTQSVNGIVQPIDILALEETTSNTATVDPIVAALNGYYGTGTYARPVYQGTQYGSATVGNGPNAIVYNTKTISLVASTAVAGTPSPTGTGSTGRVYRGVVRYQFRAVGAASTTYFYVYVSHMKSGDAGTGYNAGDRAAEAQFIRTDAAGLPAGTSLLYMGDFNLNGSTEAAYQTLVSSGTGQGIDVLNLSNASQTWNVAAYKAIMTESSDDISYRDDIQFMTADVYNGTAAAALRYVPGSYRAFGNNGSIAIGASVTNSKNTALNNLTGAFTASQTYSALVSASDHLPVIADYTVATPYNTWQLQHFTSAELGIKATSGDLADPDGDGVPNLLEYALNLEPKTANTTGSPTVGLATVGDQQYLTLTYTKVIAATGITYLPQVSGDLRTWNGGTGYTVAVSSTNNTGNVTQTVVVRDGTAISAGGKRFMRLQVSRP